MSLAEDVKDFALSIGYDRVGIAGVEDFDFFEQQIAPRREMFDFVVGHRPANPRLVSPTSMMPSARAIIVTVTDIFKEAFPKELEGAVGRTYQARAFRAPSHVVHTVRLNLMRAFLEEQGIAIGRGITIPQRLAAARAGVTTFGRNNFAFAPGIGSYNAIATFVVDAPLDHDAPTFSAPCPQKCRLCIDACPTGALYEPFRIEPKRCVAYHSFATTGEQWGQVPESLPMAVRDKMGSWIYGCDACQDACPRNQPKLKAKLPANEYLNRLAPELSAEKLLNMSLDHFQRRVLPLLFYVEHKKYFQRNAAVALGNRGHTEAVPALVEALSDPEPLVRGHAAWALGKIGGSSARQALERALGHETNEIARSEIATALSR